MSDNKPNLWGSTEAYYNYMGRWSRKIAPKFVEWLNAPEQKSWIDIGCGSGELTASIKELCAPIQLIAMDSSEQYIESVSSRIGGVECQVGDALNIGMADDEVDFAVSGLLLNFVPDKTKALDEMKRIVRPGGTVALYVWDYAGQMQIMRYFFDVARMFDPVSSEYDDGIRAKICTPDALFAAFTDLGFADVEVMNLDITTPFESFEDYWAPFLAGTGSAPKYCVSLEEGLRNKIRDGVRDKLPIGPDGRILLAARALAVKGKVPSNL